MSDSNAIHQSKKNCRTPHVRFRINLRKLSSTHEERRGIRSAHDCSSQSMEATFPPSRNPFCLRCSQRNTAFRPPRLLQKTSFLLKDALSNASKVLFESVRKILPKKCSSLSQPIVRLGVFDRPLCNRVALEHIPNHRHRPRQMHFFLVRYSLFFSLIQLPPSTSKAFPLPKSQGCLFGGHPPRSSFKSCKRDNVVNFLPFF